MMTLRLAGERGHTQIGWLDSRHSFSFGSYRDPGHTGFRNLLVINEDRVTAGRGFGRHSHSDMEIISYVVSGALGHRDSTGTDGVIRPGEIQRMTAGSGIEHSEMNASATEPVHFLQIWIEPSQRALTPGYEQVTLARPTVDEPVGLIAGPAGGPGAVRLYADARLYQASLPLDVEGLVELAAGRSAWVQAIVGAATVNGCRLQAGDGLAVSGEARLVLAGAGAETAELLVFELA